MFYPLNYGDALAESCGRTGWGQAVFLGGRAGASAQALGAEWLEMKTTFARSGASLALLLAVTALGISARAADEKKAMTPATKAVAVLVGTTGNEAVKGLITFTVEGEGVRVKGEITGLTPGEHGFHVHEFGDVSSVDGTAAGGHFNPTGMPHAGPDATMHHAGDLGNVMADAAGKATIDYLDKKLSLSGETSVLGRGIVVHAKADDLKTQPSGDSGPRVAVGVIGVAKP